MRELKREQEKLQNYYRQRLRLIKQKYNLTDKEIAVLMEMEIGQADYVRKMRNNEGRIHTVDMMALQRNLITDYGDEGSLLDEWVPEGILAYIVSPSVANGKYEDEIANITEAMGTIHSEMKKLQGPGQTDFNRINKAGHDIASQAATLLDEVKQMKKVGGL